MRFEIEMPVGAGRREREGREALRRELSKLGHAVVESDGEQRVGRGELELGVEARGAMRVPRHGRAAELRRWSEELTGAVGRFAAQLAGIELAERGLVVVMKAQEAAVTALERQAIEALSRRGFAVVELGHESSAWCSGPERGDLELAIAEEGQRRLLACADVALLAAARLQRDPALLAEVCAHGVIPWIGGGSVRSTFLHALEGELGPECAAHLGEALTGEDQLAAQIEWRLRALALGLGERLRGVVRERFDWSVRARRLDYRAREALARR